MNLPKPSGEFEWTQEAWGPALRCAPLLVHARHVFTSRALELRGAPGETAAAWAQVAAALSVSPESLIRLRQVHGARVVEVGSAPQRSTRDEWPEADVAISNDLTMALAVRVADCVPLLMADPHTGAVSAVHAGWRGTAAGVALAAVAALGRRYGVRVSAIVAAIGPSIGPCCYVVGPELVPGFSNHPEAPTWFTRGDTLRFDLWRATRDQLLRAGLTAENIHESRLCTACHTELFCSYRKEGNGTGRMAGAIRAVEGCR